MLNSNEATLSVCLSTFSCLNHRTDLMNFGIEIDEPVRKTGYFYPEFTTPHRSQNCMDGTMKCSSGSVITVLLF